MEKIEHLRNGAKTVESPEGGERGDHFGFVVCIPVVALKGVERDTQFVFPAKSFPSLFEVGMGLDGQRQGRSQHLEQKGEAARKFLCYCGSECSRRVLGDQFGKRELPALFEENRGGRLWMCPHPQLRLGFVRRGGFPEELGDGGPGAPGVVLNRVDQTKDFSHSFLSCATYSTIAARGMSWQENS